MRGLFPSSTMQTGASFSECLNFRYRLWRFWSDAPAIAFIGLNPSTADDVTNDPTVTRCMERARRLGAGGLVMLNLFAYRATDPRDMKKQVDPVGPDNDHFLIDESLACSKVICCWGTHGKHRGRDGIVEILLRANGVELYHLGLSKDGHPKHPLYLPYTVEPTKWED